REGREESSPPRLPTRRSGRRGGPLPRTRGTTRRCGTDRGRTLGRPRRSRGQRILHPLLGRRLSLRTGRRLSLRTAGVRTIGPAARVPGVDTSVAEWPETIVCYRAQIVNP